MNHQIMTLGSLGRIDLPEPSPRALAARNKALSPSLHAGGADYELMTMPRPVDYDTHTDLSLAGLGDLDVTDGLINTIDAIAPEAAQDLEVIRGLPGQEGDPFGGHAPDDPQVGVPDPTSPAVDPKGGSGLFGKSPSRSTAAPLPAAALPAPTPGPIAGTFVAPSSAAAISSVLSGSIAGVPTKVLAAVGLFAGVALLLSRKKTRRGRR